MTREITGFQTEKWIFMNCSSIVEFTLHRPLKNMLSRNWNSFNVKWTKKNLFIEIKSIFFRNNIRKLVIILFHVTSAVCVAIITVYFYFSSPRLFAFVFLWKKIKYQHRNICQHVMLHRHSLYIACIQNVFVWKKL